jgi:hypothetical protein
VVITLSGSVLFESGKYELLPIAQSKLDEVAQALKDQGYKKIIVEGHTDSRGGDEANLTLSQRRADSVRTYLVSRGIDSAKITSVGIGEARPWRTTRAPRAAPTTAAWSSWSRRSDPANVSPRGAPAAAAPARGGAVHVSHQRCRRTRSSSGRPLLRTRGVRRVAEGREGHRLDGRWQRAPRRPPPVERGDPAGSEPDAGSGEDQVIHGDGRVDWCG